MRRYVLATLFIAGLLSGCGKSSTGTNQGYRNDVSTKGIVEAVAEELGDDYWADTELAPELLDDWYGISTDMYEEYYGQSPMISANVDTLIIVKAEEDRIEDVQNALNGYKEAMVQDTFQYPMNIPKIQASRIETFGNYVCFVQLGADMNDAEEDEAAIQACQESNEKAVAVIEKELTK